MCPSALSADDINTIDNGTVAVTWDDAQKTITISRSKSNTPFAKMVFPKTSKAYFPKVDTPKVYVIEREEGYRTWIRPVDSFAVIDDLYYEEMRPMTTLALPPIELQLPADDIMTLGTAGLRRVDQHKGSYMFLAAVNPKDRSGVVAGWTTSRKGSGIIFSEKNAEGRAVLKPVVEYGKFPQPTGNSEEAKDKFYPVLSETFHIGWFDDCRLGLEEYADMVAIENEVEIKEPPAGYCTWYADQFGGACNEKEIINLTNKKKKKLVPCGFNFVQIDDGWQDGTSNDGPRRNFLRVDPNGPYPNGMQPTADYIRSKRMRAGIWLLPFSGSPEDDDWDKTLFAQSGVTDELNAQGRPVRPFKIYANKEGEPYRSRWTGATVDMTNPAAQERLRKTIEQMANDWHINYFKLDGFNGALGVENIYDTRNGEYHEDDLGDAVYHNPEITPVAAHRIGLEIVRKAAGADAFILGCNVSQNMRAMGASFGLVDAMRIGPDNGADWGALKSGPWHGTNRYFLNGRVWWNDPDPVYVKDAMPLEHARLIATWVAVSGQLYAFSDWLPNLSEERLNILRRTMRPHGLTSVRPVDFFNEDFPKIWHLTTPYGEPNMWEQSIVAFYNWDDKNPMKIETTPDWIGLPKGEEYVAFDYWGDKFIGGFRDQLSVEVPAGSCLVLAVQPVKPHPILLSTSQHVTQGIVDVKSVSWDAAAKTLSGKSRVIADDPYELRIYDPVKKEIRRETFLPKESSDAFEWSVKF
jgi:hypothetical protein